MSAWSLVLWLVLTAVNVALLLAVMGRTKAHLELVAQAREALAEARALMDRAAP